MGSSNYKFVPLIPQTTSMGCWAASIAMIKCWKDKKSQYTPQSVAISGRLNYKPNLVNGLGPSDRQILVANGLKILPSMSLDIEGLSYLISRYGPIWFAYSAPGAHISVITGNSGETLFINDPWPVNRGERRKTSVGKLMEKIGELSHTDPINAYYMAVHK